MTLGADLEELVRLAAELQDGEPCGEAMRNALLAAMERRRGEGAPSAPALGRLTVRREGVPDWWDPDNLLLVAAGVRVTLNPGFNFGPHGGNVAAVGVDAEIGGLGFSDHHGLIVLGDRVRMPKAMLAVTTRGTILLGENSVAEGAARVDSRNGGAVVSGPDGLWSDQVKITTDDMHAILDLESGRRTNRYGGRVVLDRHVWLGKGAWLSGDVRVGAHSVIGMGAAVRGEIPAGTVSVGSPARPIRHGVTWTREDLP